jgi:uncharacterized protein (DUF1778 family)
MTIAEIERPSVRPRTRSRPTEKLHVVSQPHLEDRSVIINLRAPARARDLIDSAAAVEGKSRTDFMLDTACRHAEEVLLEKRLFVLDVERYDALVRLLDAPPPPNSALKQLLLSKSPWEK